MTGFIFGLLVLCIGLFFGLRAEKKHFAHLVIKETEYADILLTNTKNMPGIDTARGALVTGNVVIANDAFKKFISGFMMFFGGRISVYESLMERARREALVRLQSEARHLGAHQVINIRVETSTIVTGKGKTVGSIELLAYGTAITHA